MRTAIFGSVVQPQGLSTAGVVVFDDGLITYAGPAEKAPAQALAGCERIDHEGYIFPGLVDIHNHGGAGVSFPNLENTEQARAAIREHLLHGTTRMLASTVSDAHDRLLAAVRTLRPLVESGELTGIHAEGPYLAVNRCGAQDPRALRAPVLGEIAELLTEAGPALKTMTIAPELPGALAAITALGAGGVVPSLGHTDATITQMRSGLWHATSSASTGRASVTHLFNGMAPMHHREPGPVPAALAWAREGGGVVELIGDGVHLAPELVREVFSLVGSENIALVTDAMAATGLADGDYELGPQKVAVTGGVARLMAADGEQGSIAGGTSHLLEQIAICVQAGVELVDAVNSASTTPAHVIGMGDHFGALRPGLAADVLLVDAEFTLTALYRDGRAVV